MTRSLTRAVLALVPVALALSAPLVAGAGPDEATRFPGRTIVEVEGDARNGFTIHRLDGSTESPPTLSESFAECGEYDDRTQVAVCRAEVRTRYAGLADVKRSLRWARSR
ncbi:MAG: hypothetical protein PGN07_00660 [Aeromicrobium erythreum]